MNAASSTLYQLDCIRKGPGQTTRVSTDEKYVNSALLACSDKARAYPYPDGDKTRSWVGGELGCVGWGYILMLSITYATTTAAERDNPALQCTKIFPPAFIACWILRLHSAKGTSQNKADSFCTVVTHDDDATCKQVKGTVGQSGYDRFYKVYGSHRGGAKRCQLILAQCTCEVKDQVLGWTLRNLDNVVVELIRKFRIKPPFQSRSHNQYVCHARARQSASHVSAAALRVAASRCQAGQQQRVQAADQLSR